MNYLEIQGWFGFESFYDSMVTRARDGSVFVHRLLPGRFILRENVWLYIV